ncbi:UDP-2,4-diacetamido-2,4,6-trideoxy-beta-L-altropyranose hydrolase [Leptolyngbya iicbica]|uniref:UDP-2,4-diacetamido-2,4, 6-trideoxy-beta-L-altropyranose hydrolase n=2 Tax=Cyanophyceae TaxID=3028117 RepID=A0A4V2E3J1_9CYAN|nr:UDP-2,4-diacetamido-2,4,6-trideoxy-beta-L-altropyranose hydrolase [Leptolyngbya sp. LK]RZM82620.1 UDP-2,4-diacetamido-2,4,6-trideoxy-beta-L-altropyranose hydrolase [Leptolyngbya sp. LK]
MVSARKDDSLRLLIRADAAAAIGTGHIMRCLALAQAWQSEGGMVTFLMADAAPALAARIKAEGFSVIHHPHPDGSAADSIHTVAVAQTLGTERVVVDGYHFGAAYQQQLKAAGLKVLFIDDNGHADYYAADWVLNQNIHAHPELYSHREPYTQLLLGTRFALLRKEFWPWRGWQRQIAPVARKILVTLGGGDPDNVTLKVMQALQQVTVPDLEVVVVVGGSNPHFETLQAAADTASIKFDLCRNVSNMPELMAWADVGIISGGSICWEAFFMGLPVVSIITADNQLQLVKRLQENQALHNLGWHDYLNPKQIASVLIELCSSQDPREFQSRKNSSVVSGFGAHETASCLFGNHLNSRARSEKAKL